MVRRDHQHPARLANHFEVQIDADNGIRPGVQGRLLEFAEGDFPRASQVRPKPDATYERRVRLQLHDARRAEALEIASITVALSSSR